MTPREHALKIYDIMLEKVVLSHTGARIENTARLCAKASCDVMISELITVEKVNPSVSFAPIINYWKEVKEHVNEIRSSNS